MQKSQERCLIGQLGAYGSRATARGDLAVSEFRSHHRTGLACESNRIRLGCVRITPRSLPIYRAVSMQGRLEPCHHLREGEPGPRASSPETLVPSSQAPWRAHGGQLTAAASLATAPGSPSLPPRLSRLRSGLPAYQRLPRLQDLHTSCTSSPSHLRAPGAEYLDLLERVRPSIAPGSRLAARVAAIQSFRYAVTGQPPMAVGEALRARALQEQTHLSDEWNAAVPLILYRSSRRRRSSCRVARYAPN
jgi:hypothetical protein